MTLWFVTVGGLSSDPPSAALPSPTTTALSLRPVLGSSDLAIGPNRLVFALLDSQSAPITASSVEVKLALVKDDIPIPQSSLSAVFRPWPSGPGGVFTTNVVFTKAGTWVAELTPIDGRAAGELARMVIKVVEQSATPGIGSAAPRTVNLTARDVSSLEELTSDLNPDPNLYSMTIAEALEQGKPLLVAFASPGFCSSATCGPQIGVIKEMRGNYNDRANFIHIEVFSNPHEIPENPSKAIVAEAVNEWGLPSEPWSFLINGKGEIVAKFEGFASREELELALDALL